MAVLFCNVAWMERYAGRNAGDQPLGGGGFVRSEGWCGEECNFVSGNDGYVYGHFETIKGKLDRELKLERLGAGKKDNYLDGVDVVWTAPFEGNDPRIVVGWYRHARVYRRRQIFSKNWPSPQHENDEIESFMVRGRANEAVLLPKKERRLKLGRGAGWSGQASWWYADETTNSKARRLVQAVKILMDSNRLPALSVTVVTERRSFSARTGAATSTAYQRYVRQHEISVSPLHDKLTQRFKAYLRKQDKRVQFPRCYRDDLRYALTGQEPVMAEIKPTDPMTLRYAIRTAIGQLLDYKQHQQWSLRQLIVVGTKVQNVDDIQFALANNFGLAWPISNREFTIVWPS